MQLHDFDYDLPEQLIAQEPVPNRETARMLVVERSPGRFRDASFTDFPDRLGEGDVLVLNNTKVFPARLLGRSETGASVEIFLLQRISERRWETLARPARRLKPGRQIVFADKLSGRLIEKKEDGHLVMEFEYDGSFDEILDLVGRTPLPPYIKRQGEEPDRDRDRYQTVYAKSAGAIAAPTAGLHFTEHLLQRVQSRGASVVELTLHVGYGTFEPVRAKDLSQHSVLPERYRIGSDVAEFLNQARSDRRRIVAVGTTTTRALESAVSKTGRFTAGTDMADLTITPGYKFKAVDALLTNFHLPMSSLLILVSTFGGLELIMKTYKHAVRNNYRFYSYGDCMLIE